MSARGITMAVIAAAVVAVLALGLRSPAIPVEHATVIRADLEVYVDEDAQTRVRHQLRVAVPVPGTLSGVSVTPGDPIEAGQIVATLAPSPALPLDNASRGRLLADLRAAQALAGAAENQRKASAAAFEQSRRETDRALRLLKEDVISAEQAERQQLQLQLAQADLQSARAQAQSAADQVAALSALLEPSGPGAAPIPIRSTRSGVVLRRFRESAGPAAAGEPLVDVGDPADLEVVAELLSEDAIRLSIGNPVTFSQWGGEGELSARVETIEPAAFTKRSALGVEEQRVRVIAIPAAQTPWPQLGDGYRMRGRFQLWSGQEVLQVNAGAIQRDRDGWSVLRIGDGYADRQAVQIGQRNDRAVEIRDGLSEGDQVVVYADDRVEDGARVEVVK